MNENKAEVPKAMRSAPFVERAVRVFKWAGCAVPHGAGEITGDLEVHPVWDIAVPSINELGSEIGKMWQEQVQTMASHALVLLGECGVKTTMVRR